MGRKMHSLESCRYGVLERASPEAADITEGHTVVKAGNALLFDHRTEGNTCQPREARQERMLY